MIEQKAEEDLISHLHWIETEQMGLPSRSKDALKPIVKKLLSIRTDEKTLLGTSFKVEENLSQDLGTEVDNYIGGELMDEDPDLTAVLRANAEAAMPAHGVSPTQGKFLHLLARIHGACRILEIGTLGGYSTIWLARALPPDGRLTSLEIDASRAEVARANLTAVRRHPRLTATAIQTVGVKGYDGIALALVLPL